MSAPSSPSWPVRLSCTGASGGASCGPRYCDRPEAATALAERVVREPLPFLVTAGEILAASLDYEQTLHRLLDIVVPTLADMCSVHLLDDDGRFRRIAARHHTAAAASTRRLCGAAIGPASTWGLLGMTERIAQVGGSVDIRSRRGEGTLVRAAVPVSGLTGRRGRTRGTE